MEGSLYWGDCTSSLGRLLIWPCMMGKGKEGGRGAGGAQAAGSGGREREWGSSQVRVTGGIGPGAAVLRSGPSILHPQLSLGLASLEKPVLFCLGLSGGELPPFPENPNNACYRGLLVCWSLT